MLVILILPCALVAGALLITYLQVSARLYPDSPPIAPQPANSPFQRVSFLTEDGLCISAWYAPPRARAGQALLLCHGLQGNRDQLLPHADYLLGEGYGVLLIDFRNHGESAGRFTSMGYHEIQDARAAYAYLTGKPEVRTIALWGHSMGGAVACKLMSEVDAAGLFVDATFAEFPALVGARARQQWFPPALSTFLFTRLYSALSQSDVCAIRPVDDVAKLDKPVLLFHGSHDDAIPLEQARQLAAANPHVRLSVFEGGGHSDLYELDPKRYRVEVLAYLAEVFRLKADS